MVCNILARQATQNDINFSENAAGRAHAMQWCPCCCPCPSHPTQLSLPDQREQRRTEDSEGRMREQRRQGFYTRGGLWVLSG